MYQEIIVDGKKIRLKTSVDEKETGVVIRNNLNDTLDLEKIVSKIENDKNN